MTIDANQTVDRSLASQTSARAPRTGWRHPLSIIAILIAGAVAVITLLSFAGINVDVAVASLFYEKDLHRFIADYHPVAQALRDRGSIAIVVCIICIALAVLKALPWGLPGISWRAGAALTMGLLIGPGLIVNGLLKPYWGRPRPVELTQFGGTLSFVDWWSPFGACDGNCSFASGEGATAAWLFGPALLVPAPWRGLAIGIVAAFNLMTDGLRIAAGGHFVTDVLMAALFTIVPMIAMLRWIELPAAPGSPGYHSPPASAGRA